MGACLSLTLPIDIFHGGPLYLIDWFVAHGKILYLQSVAFRQSFRSESILGMISHNLQSFLILWGIEINHLLDDALLKRSGGLHTLRSMPHVDTSTSFSLGSIFARSKSNPMAGSANMSEPIVREIVLVGGGHAHAYVVKNMGMKPEPGVQVTMITTSYDTPYSGMLPGYVAGVYTHDECHIDLARLCAFGKVRLIIDQVCGIDKDSKMIRFASGRPDLHYDVLSVDIGSTPGSQLDTPIVTPVKPISGFAAKWEALTKKDVKHITVVGAGAGGVELALSMQHRLPHVKFTLISSGDTVCSSHNKRVQGIFKRILQEREIDVLWNFRVVRVENTNNLIAADGRIAKAEEVIWCTDAKTQDWMQEGGLSCDTGGFVRVDEHLECENTPFVFAVGDCANMIDHPRPKAGVFAVRQGPPLAENLRIAIRSIIEKVPHKRRLRKYRPQSSFLGIIGTGRPYCVASRGSMALEGDWLWYMKDWIDHKWMASYSTELPVMGLKESELDKNANELDRIRKSSVMRCGGCGAKVGKTVLERVMEKVPVSKRPEVIVGLDAPDDCGVVQFGDTQVAQTVDFLRSFVSDPYVFGQITANHSLSDAHAMGAEPVSAMAIAVLPFGSGQIVESTMTQMMAGVSDMLKQSNCALVGGHSCEGQELSLGLSVSGTIPKDGKILSKGGCQVGDVIIQTKPIGTGVLFAAHMRTLAKGSWVYEAIESMLKSNKEDAALAIQLDASACTDITGFGLAGHLAEMIRASGESIAADIDLDAIPLLSGAQECIDAGVLSSIHSENARVVRIIENHAEVCKEAKYPLLFDPQTSGGLIITVSPEMRKKFGTNWVEIGRIVKGQGITVRANHRS